MFFHEYQVPIIFDYIEEPGLTGLEFWIETPHFWLQEMPVDLVAGALADHPELNPLTIHAPVLDLNPCSINPGVAALSVQYTLRSIQIAEALGADVITLHPGRRTAKRTPSEADFTRFRYYLDRLRSQAGECAVRIAIENMEPKVNTLLSAPADVCELLEREPWLCLTFDIAHALAGSLETALEFVEMCHERIANVHVSAIGNGMMHLPPSGDGDVATVLGRLRDRGYDGHLTLEIEDRNFDHPLSSEEKITLLSREASFLRGIFEDGEFY